MALRNGLDRCNRSNKSNSQSPLSQSFLEQKTDHAEKGNSIHTETIVITYVR